MIGQRIGGGDEDGPPTAHRDVTAGLLGEQLQHGPTPVVEHCCFEAGRSRLGDECADP